MTFCFMYVGFFIFSILVAVLISRGKPNIAQYKQEIEEAYRTLVDLGWRKEDAWDRVSRALKKIKSPELVDAQNIVNIAIRE